jgi:uncharacterized membrane protein SpoIIM required for sporulation
MREVAFLQNNKEKWQKFENVLASNYDINPDELAELYIEVTDDLSYSRTFYPKSKTTLYLNQLTIKIHSKLYKNKKEDVNKLKIFWQKELPKIMFNSRKELLTSFLIFFISMVIGIISSSSDQRFVRMIMGDYYVNMTIENIKKGDPLAVYKDSESELMFISITINNVRVSFFAFILGIFMSIGTGMMLLSNGIMLGSFQFFFAQYGLLLESIRVVWIHGTLEISAIIIAGAAGLKMGNSLLFPGTFSRLHSFRKGAMDGLKIVLGIVPMFIVAGFLESFVTRHTEMPYFLSFLIILLSLAFVIWYFIIFPYKSFKIIGVENGNY